MIRWISIFSLAVCLASPSQSTATIVYEGRPRGMLTAEFIAVPTLKEPGVLMILARGAGYSRVQKGSVVIRLPEGLSALEGDLKRFVCLDDGCSDASDPTWQIRVKADRPGRFAVTGTLIVDMGGESGRDEIDFVTELSVTSDSSWASHGRPTRLECVKGSKRYRYAGTFLIPISRSEPITQDDIVEHARVVRKTPVVCRQCGLSLPEMASVVVCLDEHGQPTEIRFFPVERDGGRVTETAANVRTAVRKSFGKWSFSPAKSKLGRTADFIWVKVEVTPD